MKLLFFKRTLLLLSLITLGCSNTASTGDSNSTSPDTTVSPYPDFDSVWKASGRWVDSYFSSLPSFTSSNSNLLPQPLSSNATHWFFSNLTDAYYSAPDNAFCFENDKTAYIQANSSNYFSIDDQKTYTISGEIYSDSYPGVYITIQPQVRTSIDTFTYNVDSSPNTVSQPANWESFSVTFDIDKAKVVSLLSNNNEVAEIQTRLFVTKGVKNSDGVLTYPRTCIRNLQIQEGIVFKDNPDRKLPVQTATMRIDELGNTQVYNSSSSKWDELFIVGAYGSPQDYPTDFDAYKTQGWNTYMWAWDCIDADKATNSGMYSFIDLTRFVYPVLADYGDYGKVHDLISNLNSNCSEPDKILAYYIDNENEILSEYYVRKRVIDILRSDTLNGIQRRPIYVLNGSAKQARLSSADFTGAYLLDSNEYEGTFFSSKRAYLSLEQTSQISQPSTIAQINLAGGSNSATNAVKHLMIPYVYLGIIYGARGMATWRDGGSTQLGSFHQQTWINDFTDVLPGEIQTMMDKKIIQYPHWTSWTATSSNKLVEVGTREVEGIKYLILANLSLDGSRDAIAASTQITLSGLSSSSGKNLFSGAAIDLSNVSIPAARGLVIQLE